VPYEVGTVARIVEKRPLPDGRSFVLCRGERRVRVQRTVQEQPYLVAEVEDLPDADAVTEVARGELVERAGQTRRAAERLLAAIEAALPAEAADQRGQLRQLAQALPAAPPELSCFVPRLLGSATAEEQQRLLEAPTALRRLEVELPLLFREQQVIAQLRAARQASSTTPTDANRFGSIGRPSLN
jgi:ATP-dependent Lon protease